MKERKKEKSWETPKWHDCKFSSPSLCMAPDVWNRWSASSTPAPDPAVTRLLLSVFSSLHHFACWEAEKHLQVPL